MDADNAHADAINCIAYYKITVGKSDGSYGPDDNVTALHMRLFVQRAADRMGADGDAVLNSVELSDPVTRLEMAQLMFGLVNDIDDDLRISPADGQIQSFNDDTNTWDVVNDFFQDVKDTEPIFDSQLVGAAYELGIVFGRSADVSTADSVFAPSDPVSRAQMASFIARTLDHSNLRPEGVVIQRNSNRDTQVSYRDSDWQPIQDARIDVFQSLYADDAFDEDDGECEPRFVDDATNQQTDAICVIDIGDQQTDDEGNLDFRLGVDSDPIVVLCGTRNHEFATAAGSAGLTFWAWTGVLDDEVDEDTVLSKLEDVVRPVGTAGPDYLRVSGGLPTGDELAKMGETVTFTAQLYSDVGTRDERALANDAKAGPDRSGNYYLLRIEKYIVTRVEGTDSDHGSDEGDGVKTGSASTGLFSEAPGDWVLGQKIQTPVDTVVWPNADGEFPINLTHLDVNAAPAVDNPDVGVIFTLRPFTQHPFNPAGNDYIDENLLPDIVAGGNHAEATANVVYGTDVATGHVIFSDEASDPHSVSGSSAAAYRILDNNRTGNSFTVTVLDQYGDGMRNVEVSVWSDLDTIAPTVTDPDEVVYPEEVDITVQANEDRDGDASDADTTTGARGETTLFTRNADRSAYFSFTAGTNAITNQGVVVTPAVPSKIEVADSRVVNRLPNEIGEDDVEGTFKTRRGGTYRVGYTYIGRTAQTETIKPESVEIRRLEISDNDTPNDLTDDTGSAPTAVEQEQGEDVTVFWALEGRNFQSDTVVALGEPEAVPVLVADVANQTIVVNEPLEDEGVRSARDAAGDNPRAYYYDEDDTFEIAGQGATFEMFEEALGLTVKANGCRVDTIEWENYRIARPGRVNRTIWRITVSTS